MGPLEVFVLLLIIGYLWALVVAAMKEQWVLFVVGIFIFPVAFVGAALDAKPGSYWSRRKGAPRPSSNSDTDLERLKKLNELKETGAISEEEYKAEKARVLPSAQSRSEAPEQS